MVVAAGVAAAAAAVGGAAISADASRSAANKQKDAAYNASNVQQQMFNTIRGDLSPYNQFGQNALGPLNSLLGMSGGSVDPATMQKALQNMPGYQFTLNQGLQSVQNSAAARGLGSSGAALRGAADYATGLAQSNYDRYYNQLMQAAGLGENAASMTGQFGTQTAQSIGQNLIGAANAQAAGQIGQANAWGGALSNIGSMAGLYAMGGFSDRRLKEQIVPIGKLDNGLTIYSYQFKGDDRCQIGLMADEVEKIHPDAVSTHESGYKMVDYAKAVL